MQNKKNCVGLFVDKEEKILIYDKVEEKQKQQGYLKLAKIILFNNNEEPTKKLKKGDKK